MLDLARSRNPPVHPALKRIRSASKQTVASGPTLMVIPLAAINSVCGATAAGFLAVFPAGLVVGFGFSAAAFDAAVS